ncbi:MAG: hypothetical protein AAF597_21500, partial [Bacteroidota bacterium]
MKYLPLLLLGTMLASCQNWWPGNNKKNAEMLQLYTVERMPTHPDKQMPDQTYVLDFAVLDPVTLRPEEATALYAALENTENFAEENRKRCPFIGEYAVEVAGEFVAVLSSSPCSKVQMMAEGEAAVRHLELTDENAVEVVMAG